MLQDIAPLIYHNEICFDPPGEDSVALVYSSKGVWSPAPDRLDLPVFSRLPPALSALPFRYGFSISGRRYYLARTEREDPEAGVFLSSRDYRGMEPRDAAFACCVGESLDRWYFANRYCGRCGRPMEDSKTERALVCPACSQTVYPKICPAVIVAVCDGDRLLLTKYRGRSFKRYALVAGFNEIGESIEDTVRREVMEETGLRVKDLRFYKSQPWVLTDSLLMGFFCRLEGSDRIRLETDELSEGSWFSRDELPDDHSGISLTGEMIEYFRDHGYPGG